MRTFFLLHHVRSSFSIFIYSKIHTHSSPTLYIWAFLLLDSIHILILPFNRSRHNAHTHQRVFSKLISRWDSFKLNSCHGIEGCESVEWVERAIQSSISTNNKNNADSAAAALWNRPFEPIIKSFTFCFLSVCFNFMAFSTLFLYYFYFHVFRNEIVLHLMNFYVALLLSKFIAARCLSFTFFCSPALMFALRPFQCARLYCPTNWPFFWSHSTFQASAASKKTCSSQFSFLTVRLLCLPTDPHLMQPSLAILRSNISRAWTRSPGIFWRTLIKATHNRIFNHWRVNSAFWGWLRSFRLEITFHFRRV